jgi:hypothetical protein
MFSPIPMAIAALIVFLTILEAVVQYRSARNRDETALGLPSIKSVLGWLGSLIGIILLLLAFAGLLYVLLFATGYF